MKAPINPHLTRRFAATLAGAWLLTTAGLLLHAPGLVLFGILIGGVTLLGAAVPRRIALSAAHRVSAPTTDEGQPVTAELELKNDSRRSMLVEWQVQLPRIAEANGGETAAFGVLRSRQPAQLRFDLTLPLFGLHRIGPTHLRIGDPFGYASFDSYVGRSVELRVYPRREPLQRSPLKARQIRSTYGAYEVSQPGDGFEFFGLRDYQTGDRPRDINWKASGRSTNLIVNQHQRENDAEIILFADVRVGTLVGRQTQSPFAQSLRAALAVADAHTHRRDGVRLVAYGKEVWEDRHTGTTRRLRSILDFAVGLEPSGHTPLVHAVERVLPSLKRGSPILIFSPLVDDGTVLDAVLLLRSREFPVAAFVPRAVWGEDGGTVAALEWDAVQAHEVRLLRAYGVPVYHADPAESLQTTLNRQLVQGAAR